MMKRVHWTDDEGRKFVSLIPEGVSETNAPIGVLVGPPDLSPLKLPLELEVALNNALYNRGLLERANIDEIRYALMAALKVDALTIAALY